MVSLKENGGIFLYNFFFFFLLLLLRTKWRGNAYKFYYYFSFFGWKCENQTCMWVWDRLTSRIEWLLKNECWIWIYLQFYTVLRVTYRQNEKTQFFGVFKCRSMALIYVNMRRNEEWSTKSQTFRLLVIISCKFLTSQVFFFFFGDEVKNKNSTWDLFFFNEKKG